MAIAFGFGSSINVHPADEATAKWTFWLFIMALVGNIIGAVALGYIALTLNTTKRQTLHLLANQALEYRPYFEIQSVRLRIEPDSSMRTWDHVIVDLTVRNIGRSEAKNLDFGPRFEALEIQHFERPKIELPWTDGKLGGSWHQKVAAPQQDITGTFQFMSQTRQTMGESKPPPSRYRIKASFSFIDIECELSETPRRRFIYFEAWTPQLGQEIESSGPQGRSLLAAIVESKLEPA